MEMLRTIIVALIFAGITVCSYYFLSSSPFPWENQSNPGETVVQNPESNGGNALSAPSLNEPTPQTFAQDGPFSPAPAVTEGEDEFALPALNELPAAQIPATSNSAQDVQALNQLPEQVPNQIPAQVPDSISPEVSDDLPLPSPNESPLVATTGEAQTDVPRVLDSELPALGEMKAPSPFDSSPAPMQAQPETQVGANVNTETTQALPPPMEEPTLDLPPGPPLDADLGPIPALDSAPELSVSASVSEAPSLDVPDSSTVAQTPQVPMEAQVSTQTVNPLRGNSASVPETSLPAVNSTVPSTTDSVPASSVAAANDPETVAVREYLSKAAEKIQQGAALEVLKELSKFYGNTRFSAEESAQLVNLLVQAATQVIYSQQSIMEPAYTVQTGDTLEKIALEYQIPEDFIARVNGLQPGALLQPGTQLKVIRGPFHAIVYLDRHEMLLTLNGLFASRFWIGIGGELIQKDGDFSFTQKSLQEPCIEFLRVAGEAGCADQMKIQATSDPNAIGGTAPAGAILMSQADVQSLTALLGPKSQLILRCHSPKPVVQQTASTSAPNPTAAPVQAPVSMQTSAPSLDSSMELPAVNSAPTPAVGSPAVGSPAVGSPAVGSPAALPDAFPAELPGTLPASAPAETPATGELPLELPATL